MNFRIEKVEFNQGDVTLLQSWQRLLDASTSPEKIYQTPAYFEFLLSSHATRAQAALLTISNADGGEIIGVVPLRHIVQTFNFRFSTKRCWSPRLKTVLLLGSVPLIPLEQGLTTALLAAVLALFPDCEGLSMTALPRDSGHNSMLSSTVQSSRYLHHVLDGWRDAHIIPLPGSFDAYLGRYSSKKRFNLKRQVRLLREHSQDTLQLQCIKQPDQVALYTSAWRQLAPPELTQHLLPTPLLQSLASHGLLHGYVLMLSGTPCAVITATQAAGVLHVHNIIYANELARFSVGVCVLYLAAEDLIGQGHFRAIDLGYSNPAHSEQASNLVQVRGNRLVLRKSWRNRVLCSAHDFYTEQVPVVKQMLQADRGQILKGK